MAFILPNPEETLSLSDSSPWPTRVSHCGLLLPSLSSAWVQCLFPTKRAVGKDTRRSSFLLCQQFRDEGLPPACAGQCAVSSMLFFRSSRWSSQSSSGSYVPLTTATRSLRLREEGKSR